LAELVPGGIPNEINAVNAERLLASVKPHSPVEVARHALGLEHLDDLRRLDAQMRTSKARIAEAITASGTSLTQLFGVRPVGAAVLTGYRGDVAPLRNRGSLRRLYRYRAHRGVLGRTHHSSPLATRHPTTQPRPPHRRHHPDPLPALPGPRLLRAQTHRR